MQGGVRDGFARRGSLGRLLVMTHPPAQRAAGGFRVLVVEDEPRLREVLCDELPRLGYDAGSASSAEQAMRLLREGDWDAVILDLNLPVTDGMSLLERWRSQGVDLPVIVLTGFGDLDAARRAIDLQVVSFLTKPCPLGHLDRALSRAMRMRLERGERERENPFLTTEPAAPSSWDREPSAGGGEAKRHTEQALSLAEVERRAILDALRRHRGNRTAAAAELGISRRTLYSRLSSYGEPEGPDRD